MLASGEMSGRSDETVLVDDDVVAVDGDSERAVALDPLSRGAQASHVEEVRVEEIARARRPEVAVRLRHMTLLAHHRLGHRVAQEAAMHRAASDLLEDEVVR